MPKHDGTGPDGQGFQTGQKLGKCAELSDKEKLLKIGKGMGKKRNSGGDKGKGKRLKNGLK